MHKDIKLLVFLTGVFCASLIISNILAFKTFNFIGYALPAAVIMFPIVYIVNDLIAEIYDFNTTKLVILTGFFMNLIAVIAYTIAIELTPSEFFYEQSAFKIVLSNSFRVLVASFTAYLIGSFTNLKIMSIYKNKHKDKHLAFRCIFSTILGESIDALLFISIAFMGTMSIFNMIQMIILQATFKIIYECIWFPITKYIILLTKERVEGDARDR